MCKSGSSKIKQSAVVVMVVILISKLMGLLRDVVLAKYYGKIAFEHLVQYAIEIKYLRKW